MKRAYCRQSSLILYFFSAAGRTFQHGSLKVTLKLLSGLSAEDPEPEPEPDFDAVVDVDVEGLPSLLELPVLAAVPSLLCPTINEAEVDAVAGRSDSKLLLLNPLEVPAAPLGDVESAPVDGRALLPLLLPLMGSSADAGALKPAAGICAWAGECCMCAEAYWCGGWCCIDGVVSPADETGRPWYAVGVDGSCEPLVPRSIDDGRGDGAGEDEAACCSLACACAGAGEGACRFCERCLRNELECCSPAEPEPAGAAEDKAEPDSSCCKAPSVC